MAIFIWSTPVLLWSELSHEIMLKRKTCSNRNMPALPLSDDLKCWWTITFSSNCSLQRIRVFLSVNELILHKLVSHCYDYLRTFSVTLSRWNELILSCRKLKCLQLLNRKKGALFFYINAAKLETTLTLTLDYTSFTETFNIPLVMS